MVSSLPPLSYAADHNTLEYTTTLHEYEIKKKENDKKYPCCA
jgi:hypothetical protein